MGVTLSKKNIALIAVLIVLMFSWTLGNIINVYHDIPESEGNPYTKETRPQRRESGMDISIDLNRYVVFAIVLVIIGMWLYFSNWDDKIKIGAFLSLVIIGHGLVMLLNKYDVMPQGESGLGFDFDFNAPDIGRPDLWSISNISKELGLLIIFIFSLSVVGIIIYQRYFSEEEVKEDLTRREIMERDFTTNIENAIENLKKGKDSRTTILRCYWKICLLLEGKGVKQGEDVTPREFKNMVLSNIRIEKKPLVELTDLFEEARYSSHKITKIKREKAIKDLKNIKSKIGDKSGSAGL